MNWLAKLFGPGPAQSRSAEAFFAWSPMPSRMVSNSSQALLVVSWLWSWDSKGLATFLLTLGHRHQLVFGMADRPVWEHLVNSGQSFSDALSAFRSLPNACSGKVCAAAEGSRPDKYSGLLNHTWMAKVLVPWKQEVWT